MIYYLHMADEVTPIVETVPTEAPAPAAEPVVVAEEVVTPVVETPAPLEAPIEPTPTPVEPVIEPTLNPAEAESGSTTQTLNPTEVGSGATLNSVKTESGEVGALNPDVSGSGTEVAKALPKNGIRELLVKAQSVIQFRKRKKLDQVMGLFAKRTSVTNDDVEKLLHVSDATATRYLSTLEKEGKIKQTGKTGRGVLYTRN